MPTLSPVYARSLTHKGVLVTVPRLGSRAIGLDVGYRTPSGQWEDSYPIPESFLTHSDQMLVIGIKDGEVQFRFAEVVTPDSNEHPTLGDVALSAQTTGQAQAWSSVKNEGVLPTWPQTPTTVPQC